MPPPLGLHKVPAQAQNLQTYQIEIILIVWPPIYYIMRSGGLSLTIERDVIVLKHN